MNLSIYIFFGLFNSILAFSPPSKPKIEISTPIYSTKNKIEDFQKGKKGFLFRDEIVGAGKSPSYGDLLEVHYKGWYVAHNDTKIIQFDDSRWNNEKQGLKFEYGIAPIILGWKLALKDMKEGGFRTIILPPELGYGKYDVHVTNRPSIPPNSELRFDIHLINVNDDFFRKVRTNLNKLLFPNGKDYL